MEQKARNFKVEIDSLLCKGCGYCQAVCPAKVLEKSDQTNVHGYQYISCVQREKCIGCRKCLMICPDFAIKVIDQAAV